MHGARQVARLYEGHRNAAPDVRRRRLLFSRRPERLSFLQVVYRERRENTQTFRKLINGLRQTDEGHAAEDYALPACDPSWIHLRVEDCAWVRNHRREKSSFVRVQR